MDCTHTDPSTHTLESLLGVLHSKIAANAPVDGVCTPTDRAEHAALLHKLDSIERACASLDILHQKVDSLCAGMQLIRSELETQDLQPAPPIQTAADFVAITVREDAALASCATTLVAAVDEATTATTLTALTALTTLTALGVPVPHEPNSIYTNSTDILNVLWPGLPKKEQDVLQADSIRQEAELVHEADY
jgi:hypothetical protein